MREDRALEEKLFSLGGFGSSFGIVGFGSLNILGLRFATTYASASFFRGFVFAFFFTFGSGNVNVEDALFVRDDTTIRDDYGLNWRFVGEAG